MRYNQLILSLFLLFTFVIALPTPAPVEGVATQVAADKNKNNKNGTKKTTTKTTNTRTTNNTKRPVVKAADCTAAKNLAAGIKRNMDIQDDELKQLEAVRAIVTSKDAANKQNQFKLTKERLVQTVKEGMSVRENNERMATSTKDNNVMKGLKTVADAQKKELEQVKKLDLKNTNANNDLFNTLKDEFKKGKKKNDDNRKEALKGC
ncbi:hypothetical protein QIS74_00890 [Colletotrichum tabaci]|uniref:Uncharacterized protein n=1 Tax=Colletotrichum tabaci TaxID=1209068 RepID=A0AAV9TX22_9PEZI